MQTYDLTRVHEVSLSILKEIDRICRKYRIRYLMDSGTLLGAVRHQGFIPWDDDADVAFTREQYEAFIKVVRRELPARMELILPEEFAGGTCFYDFTARIIYKNSKIYKDSKDVHYHQGRPNHIWIDLFVIDKLPESGWQAAGIRFLQKTIYGLAMGHRYRLDYKKYHGAERMIVAGLAGAGRVIPLPTLYRMQRAVSLRTRRGKGRLCYYSNYQPDYLDVTLEREWCDTAVDLPFEGVELMAPKEWHQVLTGIYGDYMQMPPVSQRRPTHTSMQIEVFDDEVAE